MKPNFIFILCLLLSLGIKSNAQLYTETGTNPSFADLNLPNGKVSLGPIDGSIIDVNNSLVETGTNGNQPIISGIILQTICNTNIPRDNFTNYTRWYQEDGNTQIFRMFENEVSLLDSRGEHPRNEVLTTTKWKTGAWQEWNGRYTVIAPPNGGAAIFQIFNQDFEWPMQLVIRTNGDVDIRWRTTDTGEIGPEQTKRIAYGKLGVGFDIKIRDNGYNYECYFNGVLKHTGIMNRPTGNTYFKWGMYASPTQTLNSLMFVTGATLTTEVLPVKLTSFEATAKNQNQVSLNWQTASESNNSFFTISKSQDGKNFAQLATVKSKEDNGASYSAIDFSPFVGTTYYKLSQTDYNGTTEELGVRTVKLASLKKEGFSVYPNPVKDGVLNIKNLDLKGVQNLNIYDLAGKKIISDKVNLDSEELIYPIKGKLSNGTYILQIGTDKLNTKIIVVF
nr:T9SS type A sorting domain-containing protein [uncultured Pedobacter sp.]